MAVHDRTTTLQERGLLASLRAFVNEHARGCKHEMGDAVILIDEAADALDARDKRIEVLREVLSECKRYITQYGTSQPVRALDAKIDAALDEGQTHEA